jgi:hypothetical protein
MPPAAPTQATAGDPQSFADWLSVGETRPGKASGFPLRAFAFTALGMFGRMRWAGGGDSAPLEAGTPTAIPPEEESAGDPAKVADGDGADDVAKAPVGGLPAVPPEAAAPDLPTTFERPLDRAPSDRSPPMALREMEGGASTPSRAAERLQGPTAAPARAAPAAGLAQRPQPFSDEPAAVAARQGRGAGRERTAQLDGQPLRLTLYQDGRSVGLTVLAPGLSNEERTRLRRISADLLAELGLSLKGLTVNGIALSSLLSSPGGGSDGTRPD